MKRKFESQMIGRWRLIAAHIGLSVISAVLPASIANAQADLPVDRRSQVSPARASRIEALASKIFPNGRLDWNAEQVVFPDGRQLKFNFSLYEEKQSRNGDSTFVIASMAPGEKHSRAVESVQSFRGGEADIHRCKLNIIRIDKKGTSLGYKEVGLNLGDAPSTCDNVNFDYAYQSVGKTPPQLMGLPEPDWPLVIINYTTIHVMPDAWATITWAAVLDTDTLQWASRLPVFFNGMRRDRKSAAFAIRNDRGQIGGDQWLFYGLNEHGNKPKWEVRLPCKIGSCKVEPQVVINAALKSSAWD